MAFRFFSFQPRPLHAATPPPVMRREDDTNELIMALALQRLVDKLRLHQPFFLEDDAAMEHPPPSVTSPSNSSSSGGGGVSSVNNATDGGGDEENVNGSVDPCAVDNGTNRLPSDPPPTSSSPSSSSSSSSSSSPSLSALQPFSPTLFSTSVNLLEPSLILKQKRAGMEALKLIRAATEWIVRCEMDEGRYQLSSSSSTSSSPPSTTGPRSGNVGHHQQQQQRNHLTSPNSLSAAGADRGGGGGGGPGILATGRLSPTVSAPSAALPSFTLLLSSISAAAAGRVADTAKVASLSLMGGTTTNAVPYDFQHHHRFNGHGVKEFGGDNNDDDDDNNDDETKREEACLQGMLLAYFSSHSIQHLRRLDEAIQSLLVYTNEAISLRQHIATHEPTLLLFCAVCSAVRRIERESRQRDAILERRSIREHQQQQQLQQLKSPTTVVRRRRRLEMSGAVSTRKKNAAAAMTTSPTTSTTATSGGREEGTGGTLLGALWRKNVGTETGGVVAAAAAAAVGVVTTVVRRGKRLREAAAEQQGSGKDLSLVAAATGYFPKSRSSSSSSWGGDLALVSHRDVRVELEALEKLWQSCGVPVHGRLGELLRETYALEFLLDAALPPAVCSSKYEGLHAVLMEKKERVLMDLMNSRQGIFQLGSGAAAMSVGGVAWFTNMTNSGSGLGGGGGSSNSARSSNHNHNGNSAAAAVAAVGSRGSNYSNEFTGTSSRPSPAPPSSAEVAVVLAGTSGTTTTTTSAKLRARGGGGSSSSSSTDSSNNGLLTSSERAVLTSSPSSPGGTAAPISNYVSSSFPLLRFLPCPSPWGALPLRCLESLLRFSGAASPKLRVRLLDKMVVDLGLMERIQAELFCVCRTLYDIQKRQEKIFQTKIQRRLVNEGNRGKLCEGEGGGEPFVPNDAEQQQPQRQQRRLKEEKMTSEEEEVEEAKAKNRGKGLQNRSSASSRQRKASGGGGEALRRSTSNEAMPASPDVKGMTPVSRVECSVKDPSTCPRETTLTSSRAANGRSRPPSASASPSPVRNGAPAKFPSERSEGRSPSRSRTRGAKKEDEKEEPDEGRIGRRIKREQQDEDEEATPSEEKEEKEGVEQAGFLRRMAATMEDSDEEEAEEEAAATAAATTAVPGIVGGCLDILLLLTLGDQRPSWEEEEQSISGSSSGGGGGGGTSTGASAGSSSSSSAGGTASSASALAAAGGPPRATAWLDHEDAVHGIIAALLWLLVEGRQTSPANSRVETQDMEAQAVGLMHHHRRPTVKECSDTRSGNKSGAALRLLCQGLEESIVDCLSQLAWFHEKVFDEVVMLLDGVFHGGMALIPPAMPLPKPSSSLSSGVPRGTAGETMRRSSPASMSNTSTSTTTTTTTTATTAAVNALSASASSPSSSSAAAGRRSSPKSLSLSAPATEPIGGEKSRFPQRRASPGAVVLLSSSSPPSTSLGTRDDGVVPGGGDLGRRGMSTGGAEFPSAPLGTRVGSGGGVGIGVGGGAPSTRASGAGSASTRMSAPTGCFPSQPFHATPMDLDWYSFVFGPLADEGIPFHPLCDASPLLCFIQRLLPHAKVSQRHCFCYWMDWLGEHAFSPHLFEAWGGGLHGEHQSALRSATETRWTQNTAHTNTATTKVEKPKPSSVSTSRRRRRRPMMMPVRRSSSSSSATPTAVASRSPSPSSKSEGNNNNNNKYEADAEEDEELVNDNDDGDVNDNGNHDAHHHINNNNNNNEEDQEEANGTLIQSRTGSPSSFALPAGATADRRSLTSCSHCTRSGGGCCFAFPSLTATPLPLLPREIFAFHSLSPYLSFVAHLLERHFYQVAMQQQQQQQQQQQPMYSFVEGDLDGGSHVEDAGEGTKEEEEEEDNNNNNNNNNNGGGGGGGEPPQQQQNHHHLPNSSATATCSMRVEECGYNWLFLRRGELLWTGTQRQERTREAAAAAAGGRRGDVGEQDVGSSVRMLRLHAPLCATHTAEEDAPPPPQKRMGRDASALALPHHHHDHHHHNGTEEWWLCRFFLQLTVLCQGIQLEFARRAPLYYGQAVTCLQLLTPILQTATCPQQLALILEQRQGRQQRQRQESLSLLGKGVGGDEAGGGARAWSTTHPRRRSTPSTSPPSPVAIFPGGVLPAYGAAAGAARRSPSTGMIGMDGGPPPPHSRRLPQEPPPPLPPPSPTPACAGLRGQVSPPPPAISSSSSSLSGDTRGEPKASRKRSRGAAVVEEEAESLRYADRPTPSGAPLEAPDSGGVEPSTPTKAGITTIPPTTTNSNSIGGDGLSPVAFPSSSSPKGRGATRRGRSAEGGDECMTEEQQRQRPPRVKEWGDEAPVGVDHPQHHNHNTNNTTQAAEAEEESSTTPQKASVLKPAGRGGGRGGKLKKTPPRSESTVEDLEVGGGDAAQRLLDALERKGDLMQQEQELEKTPRGGLLSFGTNADSPASTTPRGTATTTIPSTGEVEEGLAPALGESPAAVTNTRAGWRSWLFASFSSEGGE